MAYVHIRIDDALYKAVREVLESKLKTDMSSFVRRVLLDTLLIYSQEDVESTEATLREMGVMYEMQGIPTLILKMARDWHDYNGIDMENFSWVVGERLVKKLMDYFRGPRASRHRRELERFLAEDIPNLPARRGDRR
jgi:hypothetical protein